MYGEKSFSQCFGKDFLTWGGGETKKGKDGGREKGKRCEGGETKQGREKGRPTSPDRRRLPLCWGLQHRARLPRTQPELSPLLALSLETGQRQNAFSGSFLSVI